MKLNATEKNAKDVVEYLLWATKVKVTSIGLEEDLVLHPDFPSLAAVSDALNEWQVPNMATRLSMEQLKEIPLPALAYLNVRGGLLAPIKAVTNDGIEWLDTRKGWQKESLSAFAQHWDGTCLLIEPGEVSGEISYKSNRALQNVRNAKTLFLVTGIATILLICMGSRWQELTSADNGYLNTLLLKFAGTIVSGFLLWQSLEGDNPFFQSLCPVGGNCNSILQSPAAKITSWLSWSEVGFFYFVGSFISLLLVPPAQQLTLWSALAVLSLAALPYTVYSLWYQRFVARQWCVLCTAVQAILWLEAAVVLFHLGGVQWVPAGNFLPLVVLSFLVSVLIWAFVKAPLIRSGQVFGLRKELYKTKFNEKYIQAVFAGESEMPPIFAGMQTVQLGKAEAEHRLTIVTNPLCGPCAKHHKEVNDLLKSWHNIMCEFVFLGNSDALRVAGAFLSADPDQAAALMHYWYLGSDRNAGRWLKKHAPDLRTSDFESQLQFHARWCQMAEVGATPTVFLNGTRLSQAYQLRDVKYLARLLKNTESENRSFY